MRRPSFPIFILFLVLWSISANAANKDVKNIAVIAANSTTLFIPNSFDLAGKKIRFKPNRSGGYDVAISTGSPMQTKGTKVVPSKINFSSGFSFPFYGTTYSAAYIGIGRISFSPASADSDLFSFAAGPPLISYPVFSRALDSSSVEFLQTGDFFSATSKSYDFDSGYTTNTVQINLYKNGTIELICAAGFFFDSTRVHGIVGITPGNIGIDDLRMVHFLAINQLSGGARTAFAERFTDRDSVDFQTVLKIFHQNHPQIFDFITVFTDREHKDCCGLWPAGNQIGYIAVQNSTKGIGVPHFNGSTSFGSAQLQGIINMDFLANYPADPKKHFVNSFIGNFPIFGTENRNRYNTLELMANLHGQRWVPFAQVMINSRRSDQLLGKICDPDHPDDCFPNGLWNFFTDTDSSVMGGNKIRDNENGSFTTLSAVRKYSKLDQYLMGLIPSDDVPPFFLVLPESTEDQQASGKPPRKNVTFSGRRINVTMHDILSAMHSRKPSSKLSQKKFPRSFYICHLTRKRTVKEGIRPAGLYPDVLGKLFCAGDRRSRGN